MSESKYPDLTPGVLQTSAGKCVHLLSSQGTKQVLRALRKIAPKREWQDITSTGSITILSGKGSHSTVRVLLDYPLWRMSVVDEPGKPPFASAHGEHLDLAYRDLCNGGSK